MSLVVGKYLLVMLGTIVEGPIVMISSGFLLRLGAFNFWPLFIALAAGDIIADIGWYSLGRFFAEPVVRRFGHWFGLTPLMLDKARALFARYHNKILVISKLTLGFGMAIGVLIVAGASHVPFRKYLLINISGELVIAAVLIAIGYFFGQLSTQIAGDFKILFLVGGVLILITLFYFFSRYAKRLVLES